MNEGRNFTTDNIVVLYRKVEVENFARFVCQYTQFR